LNRAHSHHARPAEIDRLSSESVSRHRLPLALLTAYGLAFAAAALGTALPAFDDHPGQLFRVWHVVRRGPAPWAWNPDWWAGYPELQFYPPGFAYAGALLHVSSLGAVSVEGAYVALLWLTYLAPGFTSFALLARVLGSGWAALPGAFVVLTLSAGISSGVEGGIHVGMVAARLGWAILPLLALTMVAWADGVARRPSLAASWLVAAIVLTHPAHLPAAAVIVLLAALARPSRPFRVGQAMVTLLIAAGLTAFWTIPLLARLADTRALAWGELSTRVLGTLLLEHPLLVVLLVGAALAGAVAVSPAQRVLASFPWMMTLAVAADRWLAEPTGIRWLPADRIADGAWLAVALAAGSTAGRLIQRAAARLSGAGSRIRLGAEPALAVAAVLALAALSLVGNSLLLWPRAKDWPTYAQTVRGLRLDDLWRAVRAAPPGRILFLRSGVPLVYGTQWWRPHTHITALTPLATGRAIVSGTFTHPSPVAAAVYRGDAGPGPITRLAEQLDGHEVFGRPLEALDAPTLDVLAERLGVVAIVALEDDAPRLRALDENPGLSHSGHIGPFILYMRKEASTVLEHSEDRIVFIPGERRGVGWQPVGMAYYPLWRAQRASGALETRRGPLGDLEVKLDGRREPIDLAYGPGAPELAGVGVSVATAILWLVAALTLAQKGPGTAHGSSRSTTSAPGGGQTRGS
jgi:hypothetical protein